MNHAMTNPDALRENLAAAGCSEEEIRQMLEAISAGDRRRLTTLTEAHRSKLLEQYRYSKRCLDCLDYFTFEFEKTIEVAK